ncbi:MAG: low temperature requirement protein A [Acidimicrobiia bacterium]|nr:low temperature requirement protein A [Acidimicrobiia bacterium]MDH3469873.1 low temperature requirement protein A [Acidimicrobiia bacterium]
MKLTALRPPRLRTAETEAEHRSATWLELFYDLVFVVAVAALGHRLLVDHDWAGALTFAGLFVPLWWSWASFTFYADRYDTDDLGQRLLAVAQMVAIALMAASISGESESAAGFAVAFVLSRLVLLTMYTRAYRHVPGTRQLVGGYLRGFTLGGAFWVASIWVPDPTRFVLWGIGLAIDFVTPYILRRVQAAAPMSKSHLPERFGLFTILVLGESIAAVVAGLSEIGWEAATTFGAVVGVITASGLWWIYFDNLEGSVVRRRAEQRTAWKPTVWIYSHLPLALGLTAAGIGLEFLVAQESHAVRWVAIGGMATALFAMGIIHFATEREGGRDVTQAQIRLVAVAVVLVLGLVSESWSPNVLLVALALVAISQAVTDLVITGE